MHGIPENGCRRIESGGQRPPEVRAGFTRGRAGRQPNGGACFAPQNAHFRQHRPEPFAYSRGRAYLVGHDRPFPLPEHLCGAAGELFRPRRADPGRRAAADQAEPAAGGPSRPRSGPAREPGRRRNPRRQAAARRRRPDRDGLCRPPVRPFRAPARRRPRHPARRGHRRRRRPPRHPAQGLGPDAVLAPRRRPRRARAGAARIHRQRGDVRAGHPDHALARRRDHRRERACARPCCPARC